MNTVMKYILGSHRTERGKLHSLGAVLYPVLVVQRSGAVAMLVPLLVCGPLMDRPMTLASNAILHERELTIRVPPLLGRPFARIAAQGHEYILVADADDLFVR
jgi:hypothetical protein